MQLGVVLIDSAMVSIISMLLYAVWCSVDRIYHGLYYIYVVVCSLG